MDYKEAMEYIHSFFRFGSKLDLERIEILLNKLGNPEKNLKIIHVAGTNGKGSVVNILGKILEEEGYRVGVYTSPYLEYFEERIKINGSSIGKNDLADLMRIIKEKVDEMIEEGFDSPTEFEVITAASFLYYFIEKVDYVVLEVGLGGRFDATNVVTPILTIITSISYDHMNILGNTIEEIAFEKAGIIKKGIPLILYPQLKEAESVILKRAEELKAPVTYVDNKYKKSKIIKENGKYYIEFWSLVEEKEEEFKLGLLGEHQILNSKTAIEAALKLIELGHVIKIVNIKNGIKNVKHNGRFEILKDNPKVIIDGAHNGDGIKKLVSSMNKYFKWEKLIIILGVLKDKEYNLMLKDLGSIGEKIVCVSPLNERALDEEELLEKVLKEGIKGVAFKYYKEAYEYSIKDLGENDILLIAGSLYMIGEFRKIIKNI